MKKFLSVVLSLVTLLSGSGIITYAENQQFNIIQDKNTQNSGYSSEFIEQPRHIEPAENYNQMPKTFLYEFGRKNDKKIKIDKDSVNTSSSELESSESKNTTPEKIKKAKFKKILKSLTAAVCVTSALIASIVIAKNIKAKPTINSPYNVISPNNKKTKSNGCFYYDNYSGVSAYVFASNGTPLKPRHVYRSLSDAIFDPLLDNDRADNYMKEIYHESSKTFKINLKTNSDSTILEECKKSEGVGDNIITGIPPILTRNELFEKHDKNFEKIKDLIEKKQWVYETSLECEKETPDYFAASIDIDNTLTLSLTHCICDGKINKFSECVCHGRIDNIGQCICDGPINELGQCMCDSDANELGKCFCDNYINVNGKCTCNGDINEDGICVCESGNFLIPNWNDWEYKICTSKP